MSTENFKVREQLSSNWNYTNIQLDFYFAFAKDQYQYQCAIQNGSGTNLKESTINLISSMKQFVKSIQYLFYEYLISEEYQADAKKYQWDKTFKPKDFDEITFIYKIENPRELHDTLPLMIRVVDIWSQKYGCFRTYNQKIVYESFEDELDYQMSL